MQKTIKYIIFVIGLMWLNYPQTAYSIGVALSFNSIEQFNTIDMKSKEIWKDIKGYEGYYKISNLGRIKSFYGNEKFISTYNNNRGYIMVRLSLNKNRGYFLVHRLIALHFIANEENKRTVNHKDGNKLNNKISNLEWATYSENERHAIRTGLKVYKKGKDSCLYGKIDKDARHKKGVIQYTKDNIFVKEYCSAMEAERNTGIGHVAISHCLRGNSKTSGGYKWKYKSV